MAPSQEENKSEFAELEDYFREAYKFKEARKLDLRLDTIRQLAEIKTRWEIDLTQPGEVTDMFRTGPDDQVNVTAIRYLCILFTSDRLHMKEAIIKELRHMWTIKNQSKSKTSTNLTGDEAWKFHSRLRHDHLVLCGNTLVEAKQSSRQPSTTPASEPQERAVSPAMLASEPLKQQQRRGNLHEQARQQTGKGAVLKVQDASLTTSQNEGNQRQVSREEKLEEEVQQVKRKLGEAEASVSRMTMEIDELLTRVTQAQEKEVQLSSGERSVASAIAERDEAMALNHKLAQENYGLAAEKHMLTREMNSLTKKSERLVKENESLTEENQTLTKDNAGAKWFMKLVNTVQEYGINTADIWARELRAKGADLDAICQDAGSEQNVAQDQSMEIDQDENRAHAKERLLASSVDA